MGAASFSIRLRRLAALGVIGFACGSSSQTNVAPTAEERTLEVTATAYNSLPGQTQGDPALAAWGDRLKPGMRAIAVSRDLLEVGLQYKTEVRIEGMPGTWRVLDKLHRRWKKRIDLYMGTDVEAARRFGKRKLRIYWTPKPRQQR